MVTLQLVVSLDPDPSGLIESSASMLSIEYRPRAFMGPSSYMGLSSYKGSSGDFDEPCGLTKV